MPNRPVQKQSKKRYFLIVLVAVLLVAGWLAFRFFNPDVGFAYYVPSYLPPNVSIKARRISMTPYSSTQIEQNFRTVDWVYEIQEYKADSHTTIGTAEQNYNPMSTSPTCSILTSPAKQQYRLCHWIDYGRIGVYQVIFIKGGTYVRSDIPTTLQQKITIQGISKYVDSFMRKSTIGLPVVHSNF